MGFVWRPFVYVNAWGAISAYDSTCIDRGSHVATVAALVAASLEEALSRGFLVEVDTRLRKWMGRPELRGDELRLQRLVWMCDTNQSCIAEFNAILTSTFAHVLLQRHAVPAVPGPAP